MWFQILKKDLKKRKSINIILLIFVILSTMFLASSVSNINLVFNGLNNYMEMANVGDLMVILSVTEEQEFLDWIHSRDEITEFGKEELCVINREDIVLNIDDKETEIEESINMFLLGYTGTEYAKALDAKGNDLSLEPGEIGVSTTFMKVNHLKVGDCITIKMGEQTYSYHVVECKDILYGNGMLSEGRFLLHPSDYNEITKNEGSLLEVQFSMNSTDLNVTKEALDDQKIMSIITIMDKDMLSLMYVYDMIVATLLIVIGICLILISILILRFSLVFTMEENYQEIGVMKALGMRNRGIRKIYLIKYLVIVLTGAIIGFVGSIPVGNMLLQSVTESIAIPEAESTWIINLLCSLVIILFMVGMCLLFTGRMEKISAVMAIRSGETGERYRKRRGINLYKKARMGTISFLGLNDVLCNKKRYIVLLLTFCISFVLISIPLNTLTTMESTEMALKFDLNTESAIYADSVVVIDGYTVIQLQDKLKELQNDLEEKGYQAQLSTSAWFYQKWSSADDHFKVPTLYPIGGDAYLEYEEGVPPVLENEMAFSKRIMEQYDFEIGDTVTTTVAGEEKEFIITAYYTDYMQLGKSARFSPAVDMSKDYMGFYWKIMVNMDTDMSQMELKERFTEEFPQYTWLTAQDIIDHDVGPIKDTMESLQIPMTILLCMLIMLVSFLMMRLFIVREKGQIAMLKSIGFKNRSIRLWLVIRMIWVAAISMVFSVPLSMLSNRFVLTPVFAIMGAELTIQVEPIKAYLIYPGILLVGIIFATAWATGRVMKISTKDMTIAE